MNVLRQLRWRAHGVTRGHCHFAQGTTQFFICYPRLRRSRRPAEYAVSMGDNDPIVVTREQFVNLDQRLRGEPSTALLALDEAIALLESDRDETADTEENDDQ